MYCIKCGNKLRSGLIEGRQRYYCASCGYIHYENPLPVVAGLCYRKKGELLLIKRGVEPAKGRWALPTGFLEIDESIEQGLLRELNEEIGLEAEQVRHIKLLDAIQQYSEIYNSVIVIGYKVWLQRGVKLYPSDDAIDLKFFNLDSLPAVPFVSQRCLIKKFITQQ